MGKAVAVTGTGIKGIFMIQVVLISNHPAKELGALSQQSDMAVLKVLPTTMENIIEQIGDKQPDIIIIGDSPEGDNRHPLCRFLTQCYPNTHTIVLVDTPPTMDVLAQSGFSARGYITPEQHSMLAKAVRVVFDGEAWLPRRLVSAMVERNLTGQLQPCI